MSGMAAARWVGEGRVEVDEIDRPQAAAGRAIIDVGYVGLCGTDLHIWQGEHPRAQPPLVMGHEIAGTLHADTEALPAGTPVTVDPLLSCGVCTPCTTGRPHVCRRLRLIGIDVPGGLAEQLQVASDRLVPLPAGADLASMAFVEPLAVAVHAVRRARLSLGERVMVVGAGPIGLSVARCAALAGAREVFVAEPSPPRRRLAERLGFTVLDRDDPTAALLDATGGEGAGVVFDSAAHPAVAMNLAGWTATSGRIVFVGVYGAPAALDLQDVVFRELETVGCRVYTRDDILAAIALITDGRFDPAPLITDTVALADVDGALHRLRGGEGVKVLVEVGR